MRRACLVALLALALPMALAACGDDGDTTTVTETTGTGTEATEATDATGATSTETTGTDAGAGPSGELTTAGVGEATRGSTTGEVEELFGPPVKTQEGPGCELDPDSSGSIAYFYALPDGGRLALNFDIESRELGAYRNTSPSLQTERGDRVGDPFSSVQANWGDSLQTLDLGVTSTGKAGIWVVKDGDNELLFDIRGGKVAAISGGHIEICE